MPILHLVRHAKPASTWGEAVDPGLDAQGVRQAADRAAQLHRDLERLPIYSSPMRRCIETSAPLSQLWARPAEIVSEVAEIPSPPLSPTDRQVWLQTAARGTWTELQANAPPGSPDFSSWRQSLLARLRRFDSDCVIYTHYIAINVAVGAAQGTDQVISFRPGHASVTRLDVSARGIVVLELGDEGSGSSTLLAR